MMHCVCISFWIGYEPDCLLCCLGAGRLSTVELDGDDDGANTDRQNALVGASALIFLFFFWHMFLFLGTFIIILAFLGLVEFMGMDALRFGHLCLLFYGSDLGHLVMGQSWATLYGPDMGQLYL